MWIMTAQLNATGRLRKWVISAFALLLALIVLALISASLARRRSEVSVRLTSLQDAGGWRVARFAFTNSSAKPFWLAGYEVSSQNYERFGDIPPGKEMMLTIPVPAAVTNATEIRFQIRGEISRLRKIINRVGIAVGKPKGTVPAYLWNAVPVDCTIPKAD